MPQPVVDGHNIVITGAWNTRLFSPQWVATNLADGSDINIALALTNLASPIRLQFRGVYLRVGAQRLTLSPVELNDAALETMQNIARRILELLSHTPVTAVGVNFQYLDQEPHGLLVDVFRFQDNNAIADYGGRIEASHVRRQTRISGNLMNILLDLRADGAVTIEFNHHTDVTTAAAARTALDRPILELRNASLDALRRIYAME